MKNWEEVDFVTLGCSKNLVDSESLMGLFERNGFRCTHDAKHPKAEIVVINTCGFIEDAKQESIDTILAFAQKKDEGRIKRLYVMGCLSQRYQKELEKEIPQVDKWYGKFNFKQLLTDLVNGNDNGNVILDEGLRMKDEGFILDERWKATGGRASLGMER